MAAPTDARVIDCVLYWCDWPFSFAPMSHYSCAPWITRRGHDQQNHRRSHTQCLPSGDKMRSVSIRPREEKRPAGGKQTSCAKPPEWSTLLGFDKRIVLMRHIAHAVLNARFINVTYAGDRIIAVILLLALPAN